MAREQKEHTVKIFISGETGVGRNSLIMKEKKETGPPTEAEVYRVVRNGVVRHIFTVCKGGLESARPMVMCLVYDVTDSNSFEKAKERIKQARVHGNTLGFGFNVDIPIVLIGNKCDLTAERIIATSSGQALADEYGIFFIETSATKNINVNQAFDKAVQLALQAKGIKWHPLLGTYGSPALKKPSEKKEEAKESKSQQVVEKAQTQAELLAEIGVLRKHTKWLETRINELEGQQASLGGRSVETNSNVMQLQEELRSNTTELDARIARVEAAQNQKSKCVIM